MLPKNLFKKPRNVLEGYEGVIMPESPAPAPEEMYISCPDCKNMMMDEEALRNLHVCSKCGKHFRISARDRLAFHFDEGSFTEWDEELESTNLIGFPQYDDKLNIARRESGEREGVLTGRARVEGIECAVFSMNPFFMMGSMGTVVGEKITRLFERAAHESLPVVGFTVSGGARIQEGVLSLMQMAKTSGAVARHSEEGNLYIAVLTDPTTGGVVASFAMEADIIVAEPRALIGFAGPRVIEQTMRQKLPDGFQRSEFLLEKGFVDMIVDRRGLRERLARILKLHARGD